MSGPTAAASRSCTAAVFHAAGQPLKLTEFPLPEVAAGEALVRIECCTICGSDLHTITGARQEPAPSILGHEALGEIAQVGDPPPRDVGGRPLAPGDRVTWSVCLSCGDCDRCRRGMSQKCRRLAKYGHEIAAGREALSGGLAEFLLLRPGSAIIRLGDMPDMVACPANCATATIAAAYRSAGHVAGQRALIFGAGMLGLTAAAFARSHDAAQVVICDVNPDRLRLAKQFGADGTVLWTGDSDEMRERLAEHCPDALFDLILELSGAPDAVEAACRHGDIGADIVLVGTVMGSRPVRLDPERIVRQWLSIRGVHNYSPEDLKTAVDFLQRFHSQFPFADLVERTYPLTEANEAIDFAVRRRPVRIALRGRE